MTTLEGYKILSYLESKNQKDLLQKVPSDSKAFRYTPLITTNQMARMGYEGKDIPEEDMGEATDNCPILQDDECPIYAARPFGCRCMVSKHICHETGYAEVDPFIVTVNNVFMQFIEHIDEGGFFGNFIDVLLFLENRKSKTGDRSDDMEVSRFSLLTNHPMSVMLVPPEHRDKIQPIFESLKNIKVPKE